MNSLKHEMRLIFEKKRSDELGYGYNILEDGLLEKILNLSIFNPYAFENQPWNIVVVKSSGAREKLFKLSEMQHVFLEAAVTLILTKCSSQDCNYESRLVAMSLMYASKYYGLNSSVVQEVDLEGIKRYLNIPDNETICNIICLGYFDNNCSGSFQRSFKYSKVVREV